MDSNLNDVFFQRPKLAAAVRLPSIFFTHTRTRGKNKKNGKHGKQKNYEFREFDKLGIRIQLERIEQMASA